MQYFNKPQFVALLRQALDSALHSGEKENTICSDAQLSVDKSALSRFRNGQTLSLSSDDDMRRLWNWLYAHNYFKGLIDEKNKLFSLDEIALSTTCFFNTHDSQIDRLNEMKLNGLFFGYKKAFRIPGCVCKSIFRLRRVANDFISIDEYQRSSGKFDADGKPSEERSTGYAISKSDKLWFFLREEAFEQPRVFCFSEFKSSIIVGQNAQEITSIYGHCLESSRKFKNDVFYSKAVLVKIDDLDNPLNSNDAAFEPYTDHLDLFPISDKDDASFEEGLRQNAPIHPAIIRSLR